MRRCKHVWNSETQVSYSQRISCLLPQSVKQTHGYFHTKHCEDNIKPALLLRCPRTSGMVVCCPEISAVRIPHSNEFDNNLTNLWKALFGETAPSPLHKRLCVSSYNSSDLRPDKAQLGSGVFFARVKPRRTRHAPSVAFGVFCWGCCGPAGERCAPWDKAILSS